MVSVSFVSFYTVCAKIRFLIDTISIADALFYYKIDDVNHFAHIQQDAKARFLQRKLTTMAATRSKHSAPYWPRTRSCTYQRVLLHLFLVALCSWILCIAFSSHKMVFSRGERAHALQGQMDDFQSSAFVSTVHESPNRLGKRVFYISETPTGGSLKYIRDLAAHYTLRGVVFERLKNREAAAASLPAAQKGDILLFQYLLNTDFSFQDVCDIVRRYELRLVVPIHDKYFLNDNPAADYQYHASLHTYEAKNITADKRQLLELAEYLIFPSQFIYDVFRRYVVLPSMIVVPHVDEDVHFHLAIPPLNTSEGFRIGVITPPTFYKGIDLLEQLYASYSSHRDRPVQFLVYSYYDGARFSNVVVRGGYNEADIYGKLAQDHVHGLMFLNRFPETYSYALTKGLNAGLPLLYTRMGAIAGRVLEISMNLTEREKSAFIATDNDNIVEKFKEFLDFIEDNAGLSRLDYIGRMGTSKVSFPGFYDGLFLGV